MRFLTSRLYVGIAALILLISVGIFKCTDQTTKDLAAWLQAVGSVLAILSVFWVNALNQDKVQRAGNQSILAIVKTANEFVTPIRNELQTICSSNASNFENSKIHSLYDAEISKSYGKALANLPFHEAGSTEVVQALFFLQAQFAVLLPKSMDALLTGPLVQEGVVTSWGTQTNLGPFLQKSVPPVLHQIDEISRQWEIVEKGLS